MCQIARRKRWLEKDKDTVRSSAGSCHAALVHYSAAFLCRKYQPALILGLFPKMGQFWPMMQRAHLPEGAAAILVFVSMLHVFFAFLWSEKGRSRHMGSLEKTQEISESGNIIVDADTVQKMLWFLWEQMETLLTGLMTC